MQFTEVILLINCYVIIARDSNKISQIKTRLVKKQVLLRTDGRTKLQTPRQTNGQNLRQYSGWS